MQKLKKCYIVSIYILGAGLCTTHVHYVCIILILALCLNSLCIHTDIRERLSKAGSLSEMRTISIDLKQAAQVQYNDKHL